MRREKSRNNIIKKLLYVCEVDSGGITEYSILQCEALVKAGVSVFFLCKSSFPKERLSPVVKILEFEPVEPPESAFGKLKTIWRMTVGLNRYSQQILRIAEEEKFKFILFAFYKEYFSPFWIGPLKQLKKNGCAMGTIAHDPVRDFVIGPEWWHRFCVRSAFSFLTHVFVHDDTPVDFGGKRPEGIEVHQIPHGPYEVAEPLIGRLEMRKRLGFSTTTERLGGCEEEQPKVGPKGEGVGTNESNDADKHGFGTTKIHENTRKEEAQGDAQGTCAGASESDSLASELADSPVSESSPRSASGPAGARIAPGGMGSVGGNQLADSAEGAKALAPRRSSLDSTSALALDAGRPTLVTSAPADVVFLAFGQIRDGKNLDLFLRAMTRLPENVKLLVAGKGDSGSSRPPGFYQELAEELGVAERCRWDIRRIPDEEVGDIFAACDVVLVTYCAKFRSASGVLNAAVSARKPVLASSGPGPLKSVVEKYRVGVFVKPDDSEEILRGAQIILDSITPPAALHPLPHRAPKALDSAQPLATSTQLNPEWARYERENSWGLNAKLVTEAFFVKTPFVS